MRTSQPAGMNLCIETLVTYLRSPMARRFTHTASAVSLALLASCCTSPSFAQSNVATGFVETEGGRLYYEATGGGPPVVLIHGFTLDRRMWDSEFRAFSGEFRVIRYDLRGHGRSSGASGRFNHVDDLAALCDALSLKKPHLIGLSLGGWIACDFSIVYPHRVARAVLIDAYYPLAKEYAFDQRIRRYVSVGQQRGLKEGLSQWLQDPLFQPAREHEPLRTTLDEIVLLGHGSLGDGASFANPGKQGSPKGLTGKSPADIRCPVLCLVGKPDLPRFHAAAKYFADTIPQVSVVAVPDAGHMANMENPDFVLKQITAFLRQ
jgi:pimeloyl-ACP methyl ester carboxylesterase